MRGSNELLVEVSCRDSYLRLCCTGVLRNNQTFSECGPAAANPELDLCSALAGLRTAQNVATLESAEIALLNNTHYHERFRTAMTDLLRSLQGEAGSCGPLYVLDVSEGFSVLSLLAAQCEPVRSYSSVEKPEHQALLRVLAQANGVHEEALAFWLGSVQDDANASVLQRPDPDRLWSAIVLDCVETCGLVRQNLMEKASLAR